MADAPTPIERAARTIDADAFDFPDECGGEQELALAAARAAFESIDVEALARVLFLVDYPGHEDVWDARVSDEFEGVWPDGSPWHAAAEAVKSHLLGRAS